MTQARDTIGTKSSQSVSLCDIPTTDGRTLELKFTAALKNPDSVERRTQIKLEQDLKDDFKAGVIAANLKNVTEAMILAAGVKESKSLQLFKAEVDEFNVSVSLGIKKPKESTGNNLVQL